MVVPGELSLFNNEADGRWSARPNSILVDSAQLEWDEGMSPDFKKIAAVEIEEFKADYRQRFPGRSTDDLTDQDLLREVMNAEGKFDVEYAEVYGVPFSFIPTAGDSTPVTPGATPTRVRALEEKIASEITFPRLQGYRYELPKHRNVTWPPGLTR